jgi:hypothetical protein
MFRPNPQIPGGDITSAIANAAYRWTAGQIKARVDLDVEVPISVSPGARFVQGTVDGRIDFPTFGLQRYRFELHAGPPRLLQVNASSISAAPGPYRPTRSCSVVRVMRCFSWKADTRFRFRPSSCRSWVRPR